MSAENSAVEYTMTEDDYVAFCRYHVTRSPIGRKTVLRLRIFLFLALMAPIVFALFDQQAKYVDWPSMLPMLLAIALAAGLAPFLLRSCVGWNTRRRLRDGTFKSVLQRQRIELSSEGLKCSSAAGQTTTRWSSFSNVVDDGTAAYIYVTSVQAYVVPRRAFADGTAFERFVATVRRYCEAALAST